MAVYVNEERLLEKEVKKLMHSLFHKLPDILLVKLFVLFKGADLELTNLFLACCFLLLFDFDRRFEENAFQLFIIVRRIKHVVVLLFLIDQTVLFFVSLRNLNSFVSV